MTLATRENLRSFFNAFADVRLHALVLFLRHHRSNGGLGISRITDSKSAHRFAYARLYFIEPAFRYEEARPRSAGLSAIHKGQDESRRNRLGERSVIEQDCWRLSSQFERDALHRRGAIAHDPFAHAHRTREGDLVDVRITHELSANRVSTADHDVANTLGEFGRVHAFQHHLRLQRTEFTGLDHHSTTSTDGRR